MLSKPVEAQARNFLDRLGVSSDFINKRKLQIFDDATNLVVADVSQSGREHELVLEAANAWQAMKASASSEDISLIIISAFRGFERQCEIVQHSIEQGEDVSSIFKISAPPGYSEHHSGKAIDLGTMGCKPLSQEFGETSAFNWLKENAKDYGFRLSYPKNNKYGFKYEPWHWFYEGIPSIRKVDISEIDKIRSIGIETFTESFESDNSSEDMSAYLDEKFSLEGLRSELGNAESSFYFVELDSNPVGYLKINIGSAQSDQSLEDALEIERIYILKEFHGKRLGKLFFDKAVEITTQLKLKRIWLGVWEHNTLAIDFYQRQGFTKFAEHPFTLGDKVDTDWLMKLEL